MVVVTLGITVILAKLFPFGGQLVGMLMGGMYGPVFGKGSPAVFHLAILLANYIPALLVAVVFVRVSQLKTRLPEAIPGKMLILSGLVLLIVYLVPRLFASTIQGGGPAYVASMLGPFFIIPADILIAIGVARVLLAAAPRLTAPC
jgi:hypothetical protein